MGQGFWAIDGGNVNAAADLPANENGAACAAALAAPLELLARVAGQYFHFAPSKRKISITSTFSITCGELPFAPSTVDPVFW